MLKQRNTFCICNHKAWILTKCGGYFYLSENGNCLESTIQWAQQLWNYGNFEDVEVERGRFTLLKVLSVSGIFHKSSPILHLNISSFHDSNSDCLLLMVQDSIWVLIQHML